jgi:hypothetical protein
MRVKEYVWQKSSPANWRTPVLPMKFSPDGRTSQCHFKLGQGKSGQCCHAGSHGCRAGRRRLGYDRFKVVEKDGKLFGTRTLDNKGPLVSILVAAEILKNSVSISSSAGTDVAALSMRGRRSGR